MTIFLVCVCVCACAQARAYVPAVNKLIKSPIRILSPGFPAILGNYAAMEHTRIASHIGVLLCISHLGIQVMNAIKNLPKSVGVKMGYRCFQLLLIYLDAGMRSKGKFRGLIVHKDIFPMPLMGKTYIQECKSLRK